MQLTTLLPRYVEALLAGNRRQAKDIVRRSISMGVKAEQIYREVLVPAMTHIRQMHREDRITSLVEHLASRINRLITDQVQAQLIPTEPHGRKAVVVCGDSESDELGGQVSADVLEAKGWQTYFLGGGVPEDEIIELIGQLRPELFVVYGSTPSGVPQLREMIERIRDIGASPTMNVLVTGSIFDRVEGLWEEIQADLYVTDPVAIADTAMEMPQTVHLPRDPAAPKRRRRLVPSPVGVN